MRKYKTKVSATFLCGFETLLNNELNQEHTGNEFDKMYVALLAEISAKIYDKLGEIKKEYSLVFSPAQAMALRVFCLLNANNPTMYIDIKLLKIANEIHQQYA